MKKKTKFTKEGISKTLKKTTNTPELNKTIDI